MTAPTDEGDDGFRIVGIGASAGGLDACRHLLDALPDDHGMAMVLVQHLDPNHESMLVELLGRHTSMRVRQAVEGMAIEPDNLYVIPPGADLTVGNGALHLSRRQTQRGAHMPFDNLLQSMVVAYGAQVVCIILSGTGADGTAGAKAVRDSGGWVIAQDPEEAGYDGMPRSAITADVVDQVLAVAQIPEALARRRTHQTRSNKPEAGSPPDATAAQLAKIVALLRSRTAHDFTHYKPGTLQRRIERRMAMVGIKPTDTARYFDQLQNDQSEVDLLAKDLLINVTSFFRDSKVFDLLAENFIPELVDERSKEYPLRIWIAGCSSGEEAYSLTMLFMERIAVANPSLKLQVFASDVDADAVTLGRAGLYPATITESVSPARLERFFETEEHGYRVRPELRAAVVFTVQDVLVDPPFSRLDMVSCRNLLIYLQPDAQARAIATFHFGLREGGILLLGSSETVGAEDKRFEMIAKPERLFRRIGRNVPGAIEFPVSNAYGTRAQTLPQPGRAMTRQAGFGELCRRLVLENQAPASVLINDKAECLYLLGPVERYLRIASGHPSHDLLAMAGPGLRSKLRSAIHQASQRNARVVIAGGTITTDGRKTTFNIDVQPAPGETDTLLLVCFVETPMPEAGSPAAPPSTDPRVGELEQELAATRAELLGAIRSLEMNAERERAINEEAMSANEEFQSTNEELVTSKEELQSLNEELTALNGQLQETLERQRTTSNDLQNVLYSTDVATLFLDRDMNIRFFTPATRSLFNVIPGDVGRKLADLNALAADAELLADAQAVLDNPTPIEREIKTEIGLWFMRRVLPYRTQNGGVDGVVITFTDITERRHVAAALEAAKQQADVANVAKSRFLAAASHDLRQPLQTLVLIQGLLEKHVQAAAARDLVARLDQTLSAMSSMLNTLLDINQIEAGIVHPEPIEFPVGDMLDQLAGEFAFQAAEQGLALRMVSCNAVIRSDPHLLEQIIRNLLSNALKYTKQGKILLGCRRHGGTLSIEIWDTGIGIPEGELKTIFNEYHQIDNTAREYSRGLGLGLSIVQRLADLLGHRVQVRSRPGRGSVFAIEIAHKPHKPRESEPLVAPVPLRSTAATAPLVGTILVAEDDPEIRDLLDRFLRDSGHRTAVAADGVAALALVARGAVNPDLVLADYSMPRAMTGQQLVTTLRARLRRPLPAIILTGDISTDALRDITASDCVHLNKPVKLAKLAKTVQDLLAQARAAVPMQATESATPVIFVVDDDASVRSSLSAVLQDDGRTVETYASCEAFLEVWKPGTAGCLLLDAYLPGMSGFDLLAHCTKGGHFPPTIMMTGVSDVKTAVRSMHAGALDFIEKPVGRADLIASIDRAIEQSSDAAKRSAWQDEASGRVAALTPRQREILGLVLAGKPSKVIATDLGISQRTVEAHRAAIMEKTGATSLPALARLALAATWTDHSPFAS